MKALKAKLQNEQGASFLIALLVFLICGVVASVIVVSAAGAVERIEQHKTEEQAYLTLSSAAQLLKADLGTSPSFHGLESKIHYQCKDIISPSDKPHADVLYPHVAAFDADEGTILSGYIHEAAGKVYTSTLEFETPTTLTPYQKSFDMTVSGADVALDTVHAVMTMDADYNIEIVLTSSSSDYRYSMLLSIPSSLSVVPATTVQSHACSHTIHEKVEVYPDVKTGSGARGDKAGKDGIQNWVWGDVVHYYDATTYSITTEVTWDTCTISKGSVAL